MAARLGWLLFLEQRALEIWPAAAEADGKAVGKPVGKAVGETTAAGAMPQPRRLENATRLEGGEVLPGLVLEREEIWAG